MLHYIAGRSPFEGPTKDDVRESIRENLPKKLPRFVTAECMDFISLVSSSIALLATKQLQKQTKGATLKNEFFPPQSSKDTPELDP